MSLRRRFSVIPLLALLITVLPSCSADGPTETPWEILDEASARAADFTADGIVTISLESGAEVSIQAEFLSQDGTISLRELDPAAFDTGNEIVSGIYQIEADNLPPDLLAQVSFPLPSDIPDPDQLYDFELAYLRGDEWITVPSSVDPETRTISAEIGHFSEWLVRLNPFNHAPDASIVLNPTVFSGIDDTRNIDNYDPDHFAVHIYPTDVDSDDMEVRIRFGVRTLSESAGLATLQSNLAEEIERELIAYAILDGQGSVAMLGHYMGEALSSPQAGGGTTFAYELSPIEAGHFYFAAGMSNLLDQLDQDIVSIKIWIEVEDEHGRIAEFERDIKITDRVLPPFELVSPGPSSRTICPQQPVFSWQGRAQNYYTAEIPVHWTLRYIRGEDPWSWWATAFNSWEFENYFIRKLEVTEPLADGVYSWTMAATRGINDRNFNSRSSVRSDIFSFTVDEDWPGPDCFEKSSDAPYWTFLAADGYVVTRTETILGSPPRNLELRWVIRDGEEILLERVASGETVIDLSGYPSVSERFDRTLSVHIEAVGGTMTEPGRISDVILIAPGGRSFTEELRVELDFPLDPIVQGECIRGSWRVTGGDAISVLFDGTEYFLVDQVEVCPPHSTSYVFGTVDDQGNVSIDRILPVVVERQTAAGNRGQDADPPADSGGDTCPAIGLGGDWVGERQVDWQDGSQVIHPVEFSIAVDVNCAVAVDLRWYNPGVETWYDEAYAGGIADSGEFRLREACNCIEEGVDWANWIVADVSGNRIEGVWGGELWSNPATSPAGIFWADQTSLMVPVHNAEGASALVGYLTCRELDQYVWYWNGAGSGEYTSDSVVLGAARPLIFARDVYEACPDFALPQMEIDNEAPEEGNLPVYEGRSPYNLLGYLTCYQFGSYYWYGVGGGELESPDPVLGGVKPRVYLYDLRAECPDLVP